MKTLKVRDTKEVFTVWTNTDLTEGRGDEFVFAFCEAEATAKRLAKGRSVMGSDSNITKEKMLLIDNTWYAPYGNGFITHPTYDDIEEEKKLKKEREAKMLREKILDKARALGLTNEEIAALAT